MWQEVQEWSRELKNPLGNQDSFYFSARPSSENRKPHGHKMAASPPAFLSEKGKAGRREKKQRRKGTRQFSLSLFVRKVITFLQIVTYKLLVRTMSHYNGASREPGKPSLLRCAPCLLNKVEVLLIRKKGDIKYWAGNQQHLPCSSHSYSWGSNAGQNSTTPPLTLTVCTSSSLWGWVGLALADRLGQQQRDLAGVIKVPNQLTLTSSKGKLLEFPCGHSGFSI